MIIWFKELKNIEPRAGKRKAIIIESDEQEVKELKEEKEEKEENAEEKE